MYFENEELKRAENNHKIKAVHLCKDYVLKEKKSMFGSKRKRVIHAVKDISLEIPQGNIIGVLGINGAGKTTTIRMLASVIKPSSGSLMMNGVDAIKNHLWVKERINMISGGERNLYWRLTAKDNLRYFGSLYGLSGALLHDRIDRLLKIVGLEEAADIPVERYSKGMKQRLQIARGLINDPDYIFLDEPTLGLDIMIAKEIRQLIMKLARKDKKGVLLTTHYISEAEELCDYICVLDQGEMIARGTKEELKKYLSVDRDGQEPGLEEVLMKIINQAMNYGKALGALIQEVWMFCCFCVFILIDTGTLKLQNIFLLLLVFFLLIISSTIWGGMLNAIFLFSRDASIVMNLLDTPMTLFSGSRIPVSCFPWWAKLISCVFPLTYCLNIIRFVFHIREEGKGWIADLAGLILCLCIMIAFTVFLVRKAEEHNRETGELQFY